MLQNKPYVPFLKTKVAEISAFRALSDDAKELTFPIFSARPWQNASHFQLTIDKIVEATDGHPFAFGLDSERYGWESGRSAQAEFDHLFEERRGFEAYYDVINGIAGAVPVLHPTRSAEALLLQIGNADRLDRGLIIHQRRGAQIPLSDMILGLSPLPHDTVIIIDAGWSRDYPSLEAWVTPILTRIHSALPSAEVVVMASSFPDSFGHIVGDAEETAMERRLFSAMRQRFNRADLTYGDWASTRLPQGGGGGTIPSRIDVPTTESWRIFRADPASDEGYSNLASDVVAHPCYDGAPDCYGKRLIAATDGSGAGITGPQKSTEARINLHMTIQSGAAGTIPLDERPFED